jgi:hypothetical protein
MRLLVLFQLISHIETAINQSANKVYFAMFPIDFILEFNLNPNNERKEFQQQRTSKVQKPISDNL